MNNNEQRAFKLRVENFKKRNPNKNADAVISELSENLKNRLNPNQMRIIYNMYGKTLPNLNFKPSPSTQPLQRVWNNVQPPPPSSNKMQKVASSIVALISGSVKQTPDQKQQIASTIVAVISGSVKSPIKQITPIGAEPFKNDRYDPIGFLLWLGQPVAHLYRRKTDGKQAVHVRNLGFVAGWNGWKVDNGTLVWNGKVTIKTPVAGTVAGIIAGAVPEAIDNVKVADGVVRAFAYGLAQTQTPKSAQVIQKSPTTSPSVKIASSIVNLMRAAIAARKSPSSKPGPGRMTIILNRLRQIRAKPKLTPAETQERKTLEQEVAKPPTGVTPEQTSNALHPLAPPTAPSAAGQKPTGKVSFADLPIYINGKKPKPTQTSQKNTNNTNNTTPITQTSQETQTTPTTPITQTSQKIQTTPITQTSQETQTTQTTQTTPTTPTTPLSQNTKNNINKFFENQNSTKLNSLITSSNSKSNGERIAIYKRLLSNPKLKPEFRARILERIRKDVEKSFSNVTNWGNRTQTNPIYKKIGMYKQLKSGPFALRKTNVNSLVERFEQRFKNKVGVTYVPRGFASSYPYTGVSENRQIENYIRSVGGLSGGVSRPSRFSSNALRAALSGRSGGNTNALRAALSGRSGGETNALRAALSGMKPPSSSASLAGPLTPSQQIISRVNQSLTPNERSIVQNVGGVASVDKIFREAGGPIKVGEAAEILKQFPKNQAINMGLTTPKAVNAVIKLGGPNKASPAIVIYEKIETAKRRRTPQKKKKVSKPTAAPQIKVKLLKKMVNKFSKNELIRLAGENTLKPNNHKKDTLVKNFTKFIRKQPKKKRFSSTVKGKRSIKK